MGARWMKIAVLYFLVGVGFGLYMHATVDLRWAATHAHINVVGWLTTAAIGAIYSIYPQAGNSTMGKAQFWLYNIGLPFLLFGMWAIYAGLPSIVINIVVWGGGGALALSIVLFIVNVFKNVHGSTSLRV